MSFLLDTNICIAHLNGTSLAIKEHFLTQHSSDLFLCSVVKAELIYGAYKSQRSENNLKTGHKKKIKTPTDFWYAIAHPTQTNTQFFILHFSFFIFKPIHQYTNSPQLFTLHSPLSTPRVLP